jgi:hypothetical protein
MDGLYVLQRTASFGVGLNCWEHGTLKMRNRAGIGAAGIHGEEISKGCRLE